MKKLCKTISILMLVVMLTGCMKIRGKVVIEDKETASMTMEFLYSEEMMESYGMTVDDMKEQLADDNYNPKDIKEISETIEGEKYVGLLAKASKKDVQKIVDGLSFEEKDGKKEYVLSLPSNTLSGSMQPGEMGEQEFTLDQMKELGLEMTMSIQMPGKIKEASIGKIEGNTVTIDVLELASSSASEATIISEEGSSNSTLLYVALGVAGVAIIAVVAIMISKKKKKAAEESDASNAGVEDVVSSDTPLENDTKE